MVRTAAVENAKDFFLLSDNVSCIVRVVDRGITDWPLRERQDYVLFPQRLYIFALSLFLNFKLILSSIIRAGFWSVRSNKSPQI